MVVGELVLTQKVGIFKKTEDKPSVALYSVHFPSTFSFWTDGNQRLLEMLYRKSSLLKIEFGLFGDTVDIRDFLQRIR